MNEKQLKALLNWMDGVASGKNWAGLGDLRNIFRNEMNKKNRLRQTPSTSSKTE